MQNITTINNLLNYTFEDLNNPKRSKAFSMMRSFDFTIQSMSFEELLNKTSILVLCHSKKTLEGLMEAEKNTQISALKKEWIYLPYTITKVETD